MKLNEHFGQQKVAHMIENNIWDVRCPLVISSVLPYCTGRSEVMDVFRSVQVFLWVSVLNDYKNTIVCYISKKLLDKFQNIRSKIKLC
jgi:hypothetical protein